MIWKNFQAYPERTLLIYLLLLLFIIIIIIIVIIQYSPILSNVASIPRRGGWFHWVNRQQLNVNMLLLQVVKSAPNESDFQGKIASTRLST